MLTCELLSTAAVVDMGNMALLLDGLPLPLGRPLSDGLGKEGHEFPSGPPLIETERRQIAGIGENSCCSRWGARRMEIEYIFMMNVVKAQVERAVWPGVVCW